MWMPLIDRAITSPLSPKYRLSASSSNSPGATPSSFGRRALQDREQLLVHIRRRLSAAHKERSTPAGTVGFREPGGAGQPPLGLRVIDSKIRTTLVFLGKTGAVTTYDVVMRLTAAIIQEGHWYVARCLEVEVASQGETVEEARANLTEALELYFEGDSATEVAGPAVIASIDVAV